MPNSTNTADEYEFVDYNDAALSPEVLADIRDWLQPTDYLAESGEFRRHLLSQAPGTGLWICETEEYRQWHDSPDHGSLWIKGVPGAGKSVMAASIIQHLRMTEDCPVLFFFFRNIVAANFSPRALIQDWLAQLLPYSVKLQFALQPLLETSLAETSANDLIQLFLDGVLCVPKVYCVGDALDEMTTDNRSFLDKLNGLATYRPRSLKLLMTSRPKQYLQSALRDSSIVHISLQQRLVDADIISFLNHRFDRALKSDNQQKLKQDIIKMVARRSEGLFLYAKLTIDQVEASLLSDDPVDISLLEESLPVGLEQIYTNVLTKQREDHGVDMDVQVLVLEAVTHASRPLRLYELASVIKCSCPNVTAPRGFKALIATCCGPLVEVLEDETLQVIHHSFTEFLRGDSRTLSTNNASLTNFPVINSDKAHKRMAMNCLQYLMSGSLLLNGEHSEDSASIAYKTPQHQMDCNEHFYNPSRAEQAKDPFSYREARLLHPFLSYAVENWSYHASFYDVEDEELFSAIAEFLKPESLAFSRWLVIQWGSTSKSKGSTEGIPTALHIAAFSGLYELALKLIQQGSFASDVDAQERIPLHWAAANGHAKVASVLIQHGSDANAPDGRGLKPIHLAARKDHASVVRVLLEAGVEPDTLKTKENHAGYLLGGEKITKGECAIFYASSGGHTETVMAMIPFCSPETLEQLLCECCRFNRTDAVLGILDKSDVSANATYRGATALYFACGSVNLRCVEALIDRGADVRKTSTWEPRPIMLGGFRGKKTMAAPLHRLVQEWDCDNDSTCQAILRVLVKANVDLEQLDGDESTALLIASGSTHKTGPDSLHVPAMRALLRSGADLNKVDRFGNSPLHRVFGSHRDLEAVQLLIEHGSDPNQIGHRGRSALHSCMIDSGMKTGSPNTEAIVKYLLEHGADPNIPDEHGKTAVRRGMSAGLEVFRMLLSRCENDAEKRRCWFGLSSYSVRGFTEYLDLLLAEGIDIDARRDDGCTLFLCCLGYDNQLEVLREYGAKTGVVDICGNNALHLLCQQGICVRGQMETMIAKDGLDPLSTNDNGDTLLHHVASWYHGAPKVVGFVGWLVSLGIPINAVNKQGFTALHVAEMRGLEKPSLFPNKPHYNRADSTHFTEVINPRKELNFEIRDKNGLAPLHLAAMRSAVEVATLVAAGATLGFLTEDSQNALHLSCRARQPSVVGLVLDQPGRPDLNQVDCFGRTPLHYACSSGEPESVALLLKHGANVHAIDSKSRTPLHACAESRTEQDIWDSHHGGYKWLRGPPTDPLRPSSSQQDDQEPWYQYRYGEPKSRFRKSLFPSVTTIMKMLLDAGSDVSAVDDSQFTALDVALHEGCAEVAEVFATDKELFSKATQHLEDDKKTADRSEQIRQWMWAQTTLMRPRFALHVLGQDQSATNQVLKSPSMYLDLLTCKDAAKLINEVFEADPVDASCYTLLEELMRPDRLQVAEYLSSLLLHYSSYGSVRDIIEARTATERSSYPSALTPLQLACRWPEPNMLTLQLLVEKFHVDVNAQFATIPGRGQRRSDIVAGGTALHVLASANNWWQIEGMRYLISNGATVDARDEKGQTPLHIAARGVRYNNHTVEGFWMAFAVRLLLDNGADPNTLDEEGLSPLHKATGAPDIMRELLRQGADPSMGVSNPLFLAISHQNLSALEILLDHGVSVDSLDEKRNGRQVHYQLKESHKVYALLCAAFAEEIDRDVPQSVPLLRALVERGADLYLPLNEDETMAHSLFELPEYEVLNTLLQEPCVSRIDFNRRDQHGRTVLMAACNWREVLPGYSRRPRGPKATGPPLRILDYGADATLVDDEGKTALHHLLDNPGMPDDVLVQFIHRKEVAPTLFMRDHNGFLPFHYALRILRPEICDLLLSKGASLLEPDPNGLTALHYVAKQCFATHRSRRSSGHLQIDLPKDYFDRCLALWRRFLAEGGSINVADKLGNTPLLTYLSSPGRQDRAKDPLIYHLEDYEKLFPPDSGADIFAVNTQGETALHVITRRESNYYTKPGYDKALFEAMLGKGLDPLQEDKKGRSALDVASACEKDDIVGVLGRK
ncbi:Ankyrin-3 [Ilyonectria robusta]